MRDQSSADNELTSQTLELLRRITVDTEELRDIDLGETLPATIFQAD